ncbi:MAG: hypothetical protein HC886_05920 [Leptolyngbyaceae cyanobacterium SM1_1_3]|nr:hypothetical protein [Leptolyngbyaceae cyanobacterium SM1_1_3]NJN04635.1 hypothetical protein [Leptolyngbyaceae cyanobacterium RM1_1_2]NJO09188.1 hypothetical protein [Leptolyngbyaceae cyanobacterium SL_1_1]
MPIKVFGLSCCWIGLELMLLLPAIAEPENAPENAVDEVDIAPEIIESSPVLQRWLEDVPDVLSEIRNDPSFRTRVRFGYANFLSSSQANGFQVGVEDVFVGRTGLTLNGDYQSSFEGDRQSYGVDLRYYLLPLGEYVNVAPVVGYRSLATDRYEVDGLNVGLRLQIVPSRTSAADVSLTQTWVAPHSDEEVGLTTVSFGYAITSQWRLSTDIQLQNLKQHQNSRVGVTVEWML